MSKTILITGAGSGFGQGTALALAAQGHTVIATMENSAQAAELRKDAEAPIRTVQGLFAGDQLQLDPHPS